MIRQRRLVSVLGASAVALAARRHATTGDKGLSGSTTSSNTNNVSTPSDHTANSKTASNAGNSTTNSSSSSSKNKSVNSTSGGNKQTTGSSGSGSHNGSGPADELLMGGRLPPRPAAYTPPAQRSAADASLDFLDASDPARQRREEHVRAERERWAATAAAARARAAAVGQGGEGNSGQLPPLPEGMKWAPELGAASPVAGDTSTPSFPSVAAAAAADHTASLPPSSSSSPLSAKVPPRHTPDTYQQFSPLHSPLADARGAGGEMTHADDLSLSSPPPPSSSSSRTYADADAARVGSTSVYAGRSLLREPTVIADDVYYHASTTAAAATAVTSEHNTRIDGGSANSSSSSAAGATAARTNSNAHKTSSGAGGAGEGEGDSLHSSSASAAAASASASPSRVGGSLFADPDGETAPADANPHQPPWQRRRPVTSDASSSSSPSQKSGSAAAADASGSNTTSTAGSSSSSRARDDDGWSPQMPLELRMEADLKKLEYYYGTPEYPRMLEEFTRTYSEEALAEEAAAAEGGGGGNTAAAAAVRDRYSAEEHAQGLDSQPLDFARTSPQLRMHLASGPHAYDPIIVMQQQGVMRFQGYRFPPTVELGKLRGVEGVAGESEGGAREGGTPHHLQQHHPGEGGGVVGATLAELAAAAAAAERAGDTAAADKALAQLRALQRRHEDRGAVALLKKIRSAVTGRPDTKNDYVASAQRKVDTSLAFRVTGLDALQRRQMRYMLTDFDYADRNTAFHVMMTYPYTDWIHAFYMVLVGWALYQLQARGGAYEWYDECLGLDLRQAPGMKRPVLIGITVGIMVFLLFQPLLVASIATTRAYRIALRRPIGPP